jgi:hypothetical protein
MSSSIYEFLADDPFFLQFQTSSRQLSLQFRILRLEKKSRVLRLKRTQRDAALDCLASTHQVDDGHDQRNYQQ